MFSIGDRVVIVDTKSICFSAYVEVGMTATIRNIISESIGIEFDVNVGGHDLGGMCKYGYGWYVLPKNIILAESINEELPSVSLDIKGLFA